jgi:hypothetical protein
MNIHKLRNLLEWPVMIFLIVGIITAVLDVKIRGFSPVVWFLISFWFILIIICMEVSMIREHIEKNQK